MTKRFTSWALALSMGVFCLTATADTLKLVSVTGPLIDGVYIYPYNFSIDGSSTMTSLMCIDYSLHTTVNESWAVNLESIPTDGSTNSTDLRALALIDYAMITGYGGYSQSDLQFAAWSILDGADVDGMTAYKSSAAPAIAAGALAEATDSSLISSGFYAGFTLYAVDTSNKTGWTDGQPQDFIGYDSPSPTPEPSSFLLLGTGLFGTAAMLRRRIHQQQL